MKKAIVNAIVIFFVTFAVLLVASELSKTDKQINQVSQSYDFNE